MSPFLLFLESIASEEERTKIGFLYEKYHDDMVRFARRKLFDGGDHNAEYDAEDVVQNTFMTVVRIASKIDLNSNVKSYLFAILTNEIMDFFRERGKERELLNLDDLEGQVYSDDFIEQLNLEEECRRVRAAIDQMKDIYKCVFMCKFKGMMAVEEIAAFFGISVKTVYTRLLRGRNELLSILHREDRKIG